MPLTAAEQAAARGGPLVQVPVDLGAEVVVYNLLGLPRLHLTGPVIAQIFLGRITSWRDPAIMALTPNTDIPDEPISVVHRSDGSGTERCCFGIWRTPGRRMARRTLIRSR